MNHEQSIALWQLGKDAWNAWADDMLRQKTEMEKAGTWNGDSDAPISAETRSWMDAASINFNSIHFMTQALANKEAARIEAATIDVSGLDLMTRALANAAEKRATPQGRGWQSSDAEVTTLIAQGDGIGFGGFVFPWRADFQHVQFYGEADFGAAQFHGRTCFANAQFHGKADFRAAQLEQAWFTDTQFREEADFAGAQFRGEACFEDAQFQGEAAFRDAQFQDVV